MSQCTSDESGYCARACADRWRTRTFHSGLWWKLCQSCLYLSSFLKEIYILSLHVFTSRLFQLQQPANTSLDDVTIALRLTAWTLLFQTRSCGVLCSADHCSDPDKLAASLFLWLHFPMHLSVFLVFLCVFLCSLAPHPTTSDFRILSSLKNSFSLWDITYMMSSHPCHVSPLIWPPWSYPLPSPVKNITITGFPLCVYSELADVTQGPVHWSDHSLLPDLFRALPNSIFLVKMSRLIQYEPTPPTTDTLPPSHWCFL